MGLKQQSLLNGPLVKKRLKTLIGFYKKHPALHSPCWCFSFYEICVFVSVFLFYSVCLWRLILYASSCLIPLSCLSSLKQPSLVFYQLVLFAPVIFLNALIIFQLFYPSVSPSLFTLVSLIVDFTMDSICLT